MSDRADDENGEGGPADPKCKGCEGKGKKSRFFRLRKRRRQKQKGVYVNSGWCCLCVKQPRTLDSPGESPSSDPNSSEFTFDMLRALIEQNDFYSKECNPHFDADDDHHASAKQNPNI